MPVYCFICPSGHQYETFLHHNEDVSRGTCPKCGEEARRDYQSERKQVGFVDGDSFNLLPADLGFPRAGLEAPGKRLLRAVPNKHAVREAFKRSEKYELID